MKATTGFRFVCALTLAASMSGCGSASPAGEIGAPPSSDSGNSASAERAIEEADIIQLADGKLYALAGSGTVSIVDVSTPGKLSLLGQTRLAGTPFEMYLRGNQLVTMWNGAFSASGVPVPVPQPPSSTTYVPPSTPDPNAGAGIVVLDIAKPSGIRNLGGFPIPGQLADSRLVGEVLYVATYENSKCYRCSQKQRTLVTSFDFRDPTVARQVNQAEFASNAPDSYNLPWGSSWKRSLFVTPQRLYIGGHADIDPSKLNSGTENEGIIDVLDISDPTGKLVAGARIQVAGAVLSRWQMEERDGVFRVVSQRGAGRTGNGLGNPDVDTFTIHNTQWYQSLGHTSIKMPRQEGLRAVRFDKDRAYAITYNQTDPLWMIDLSNPAFPTVRGELHMPGFMFYLEPYGDRLIGLGIDRNDPAGSLNVSLFDVSNLDAPKMLSRVPFANPKLYEDYQILNYELPEDQDRIHKAFRVFPDGLIAVPYTDAAKTYRSGDACQSVSGAIQLVDWTGDKLSHRARLAMRGNPRRALQHNGELLAVSDSNVSLFSLGSGGAVSIKTADLVIGTCAPKQLPYDYGYDDVREGKAYNCSPFFFKCSTTPGGRSGSASGIVLLLSTLGLVATVRAAKQRRRGRAASGRTL